MVVKWKCICGDVDNDKYSITTIDRNEPWAYDMLWGLIGAATAEIQVSITILTRQN